MILNFSVENFRSIRDRITLFFEPLKTERFDEYYISSIGKSKILKMALIFGPNASGKTNILEAIKFLQTIVITSPNDKDDSINLNPFVLDKDKNTIFSIEFVDGNQRYLYELELNQKFIVREILSSYFPKKSLIFDRKMDQENKSEIKFGSKVNISRQDKNALIANTFNNRTVIASFLKTNIKFDVLESVKDWFKNCLVADQFLTSNRFINELLEPFLQDITAKKIFDNKIEKIKLIDMLKAADFSISDINIESKNIMDGIGDLSVYPIDKEQLQMVNDKISKTSNRLITKFSHGDFDLFIKDESAGTRRYYVLMGMLLEALTDDKNKTKVFLVDELEKSLHTELVEHFILTFLKVFKAYNFQLIATTHNRELLMDKDIIRKDIIWFTDRKPDGSTDLFSLADFKSSEIRNANSFYNFYKSGRIGATPNLLSPLEQEFEE